MNNCQTSLHYRKIQSQTKETIFEKNKKEHAKLRRAYQTTFCYAKAKPFLKTPNFHNLVLQNTSNFLSVATLHEQVSPTIRMKNPYISLHNLKQKTQSAIIFSYNI